jgi:hypothetical protein
LDNLNELTDEYQNKPLATICECSAEYLEKLISLPARGIAKV